MIVSEKSHQNLSEYIQFLFLKISKFNKNGINIHKFFSNKNFKREKLNPSYEHQALASAFFRLC